MAAKLALLLAFGALPVHADKQPLISTDLVYATYDMLAGVCSTAYAKAGVDDILAKVPVADLKAKVDEQMKALPPDVTKAMSEAQVKAVQVKAMAMEYIEKAQAPAEEISKTILGQLEALVPALKGHIGAGPGNLALFAVYMGFVLYILLKIALFVLRMALGIFCFCCCCGCCRGGKKTEDGKAKAKAKAKAANGNNKAAASTGSKADPKAAAKKK